MFSSASDEWATPQEFFDKLNEEFHFTLDPCALSTNAKCDKFFTPVEDGLIQDWGGGDGVLQSSLWSGNKSLGAQVYGRVAETEHHSCGIAPCTHGYSLFSRVHISESERDTIRKGTFEIWRV